MPAVLDRLLAEASLPPDRLLSVGDVWRNDLEPAAAIGAATAFVDRFGRGEGSPTFRARTLEALLPRSSAGGPRDVLVVARAAARHRASRPSSRPVSPAWSPSSAAAAPLTRTRPAERGQFVSGGVPAWVSRRVASRLSTAATSVGPPTRWSAAVGPSPLFSPRSSAVSATNASSSVTSSPA